MGRRALGVLALAGAVALGGCHDPTEIVVVVDSDLRPGADLEWIQFVTFVSGFNGGPSRPPGGSNMGITVAQSSEVPATLGLIPLESNPRPGFDIMVKAIKGFDFMTGVPIPVVQRRVSNVVFVKDQIRVLFIPLLRQCMCQGTNCNTDPPCDDITVPTLLPFDEDNLPHL